MQIFLTIIAGTCTFVFGQIFLKLYIEPIQTYKTVISEIADKLILYANIYANPKTLEDPRQAETCKEFRILSSKLQASMHLVPSYGLMAKVFGLPSIENVAKASKNLIRLHNGHDHVLANQGILNCYSAQKIRQALNIYTPSDELFDPALEKEFIKAKSGN
ncbi:hypothetical protein [Aeromonas hydrophila]|uniref:hypothetical protein n=1 Tax=Aeromonas hydrophila TaxID=644 RepID=UPI000F541139|nr:hypothetical protein [Aeromonas hydrophila]RQM70881.1 hypothetical protein EHZ82_07150 [Aeromonas hydrophila]